ncbi:unnamed protein product [Ixodes persulcatus]
MTLLTPMAAKAGAHVLVAVRVIEGLGEVRAGPDPNGLNTPPLHNSKREDLVAQSIKKPLLGNLDVSVQHLQRRGPETHLFARKKCVSASRRSGAPVTWLLSSVVCRSTFSISAVASRGDLPGFLCLKRGCNDFRTPVKNLWKLPSETSEKKTDFACVSKLCKKKKKNIGISGTLQLTLSLQVHTWLHSYSDKNASLGTTAESRATPTCFPSLAALVGAGLVLALVPWAGCNQMAVSSLLVLAMGIYGLAAGGVTPAIVDMAPAYAAQLGQLECGLLPDQWYLPVWGAGVPALWFRGATAMGQATGHHILPHGTDGRTFRIHHEPRRELPHVLGECRLYMSDFYAPKSP